MQDDVVVRLRRRAEELRSGSATGPLADLLRDDDSLPWERSETESVLSVTGISAFGAESDHMIEARRNWRGLVLTIVAFALVGGAIAAGSITLLSKAAPGQGGSATARGEDAAAPSVLDQAPPSLDELTSEVTLPPGPATGLQVVEKGITIVSDRFDDTAKEGTFAVIVENPHRDWLAQGVDIDVTFLDVNGQPVGSDTGFVAVVLPGQRVAIASLVFNAPSADVRGIDAQVDVARWRRSPAAKGDLVATVTETVEDDLAGVRTTFTLLSTLGVPLSDVGVTAVYRDAAGAIIGGFDSFVDRVEPNVPVEGTITLLVNVDPAAIATTELYPTVGFGFRSDT